MQDRNKRKDTRADEDMITSKAGKKRPFEPQLSLYIRDEIHTWCGASGKNLVDLEFRKSVATNVEQMVKKAEIMACRTERENVSIWLVHFTMWTLT